VGSNLTNMFPLILCSPHIANPFYFMTSFYYYTSKSCFCVAQSLMKHIAKAPG
jgi:hypothetical protein